MSDREKMQDQLIQELMERLGQVTDVQVADAQRREVEANLEKELTKFQALYDLAVAMTGVHSLDENLSLVVEKSMQLLSAKIGRAHV